MSAEDREILAAERALGLEPADDETPAEASLREAWELRFGALAYAAPEVDPGPEPLRRVEREMNFALAGAALRRAERARKRWRAAALALGALCICLALIALGA